MRRFRAERCKHVIGRQAITTASLAVLLCMTAAATAYSSYGLGNLECEVYLERRALDQAAGSMQSTSFIHAYLSGYLTAGNMMHGLVADDAKDIAVNVHSVVQWLDAWCVGHNGHLVSVALESFWVEAAAAKEQLRRNGGKLPAELNQ